MTPKLHNLLHGVLAGVAIFLVIIGVIAANAWHNAMVARARLEATMQADKAHQGELTQQAATIAQDLKQRIAALESDKARTQTPSEIIKEVPVYLPANLPAPITTVTQPAAPGAKDQTPVITGAMVPASDFKPIFDQLVECKECAAKLSADDADLRIKSEQLVSVTRERDAAIKAVKGGSFFQRLKHDAKAIGYTALTTVAVVCGTGHCK